MGIFRQEAAGPEVVIPLACLGSCSGVNLRPTN